MKIAFYRADYAKKFNTRTFLTEPVGGTEFGAGYLALELAKKHQVFFICQTPQEGIIDQIHWLNFNPVQDLGKIREIFHQIGPLDVLILVGGLSNLLDHFTPEAKQTILWANGVSLKPNTINQILQKKINQIVCASEFAKKRIQHNTFKRLPLKNRLSLIFSPLKRKNFDRKFTFIYYGINLDLFSPAFYDQNPKIKSKILYSGVLNQEKNADKIIAVFSKIKKAIPEAELHICGSIQQYKNENADQETGFFDGDHFFKRIKPYLDHYSKSKNSNIFLRGALPPDQLMCEMMSAALVIVNPKVKNNESFCIGAIEAQAAGTPVIGGGYSALEETILHNKTGFIFRKQKQLPTLVIKILKNQSLLQKIGENGRKRACPHFGWKNIAKEWETLFEALLKNQKFIPQKH